MLLRSVTTEAPEVSLDQRTVTGLIAPYERPTDVNDGWGTYRESFGRGAFRGALKDPSSIKFLGQHDQRAMPLGRCIELRDDAAGPIGTFKVSKTRAGDEYLELARDGAVDGLSVGFMPVAPGIDHFPKRGEEVVRTEVKLREVSGVTWPAYDEARVSDIRSAIVGFDIELVERIGKTHSAATVAGLKAVHDLLGEASEKLAQIFGDPSDEHSDEPHEQPASAGRGSTSAANLRRQMRMQELTSALRRAASAAQNRKDQ